MFDLSKYSYAEVRIENRTDRYCKLTNDEIKTFSGSTYGASVRVLEKGSWGFVCGNSDISSMLKKAQKLALLESGKIKLATPPSEKKTISLKIDQIDEESKIKQLQELSKEIKDAHSRTISLSDSFSKTEFYNSEGAEIIQDTSHIYLSSSAVAKEGTKIQKGSSRTFSRRGFNDLKFDIVKESKEKAYRLLKAINPPKGRFDVVFDPELTGVFSHEALGHATEADSIIDRESILSGKVGATIGNELVTIIDDPTANDFGQYHYDDEGIKAQKTVLIEKGVLKNYINSLETAEALSIKPNGHARADGYNSTPIVRMSNTYFQSGKSKIEEVFDIKEGLYLKGMKGGSVDIFSGGFMFKAEEAYWIKKGETSGLMHDVTITGNILETLNSVDCIGNDFGTSPGICGKFGQSAPVSDGGPHVRVKNVSIG